MAIQNIKQECRKQHTGDLVEVMSSCFVGSSGTAEYNFMLKPLVEGNFDDQLNWLDETLQDVLRQNGVERRHIVFRRFFCNDLPGQVEELCRHQFSNPQEAANGAVSLVIQPPAEPACVALWVYCVKDKGLQVKGSRDGTSFMLTRGDLEHVWTTGLTFPEKPDSHAQTQAIFESYKEILSEKALNLKDHCLRTWFYVKDVDSNYHGLVTGRNEVFSKCNLTPNTHFIASTGIQASFTDADALVMMDAYAVRGLQPEQIKHLQALDHLSHTHVYGVAFERATAVAYRDRKHIIVSGTASIDSNGDVVHEGEVERQLDRTLENIAALLAQVDAGMDDMQHYIVYLRNSGDEEAICDTLRERMGDKPFLVVTGRVCRPNWLVEIEGVAIIPNVDHSLPAF